MKMTKRREKETAESPGDLTDLKPCESFDNVTPPLL